MQSTFNFAPGHTVRITPPSFPAGAAAYEHQRAMGVGVLQPTRSNMDGLNAAFLPAATAYRVWPCAQRLAEYMYQAVSRGEVSIAGGHVLELGAGCGLVGFACMLAGAQSVCLSDLPENLPRLRELVAVNRAEGCCTTCAIDWTCPLPPGVAATRWRAIVAADCVFWPALFKPLLATLDALRHAGASASSSESSPPPRVFLAMTDRIGRAREFAAVAREAGWTLERLGDSEADGRSGDTGGAGPRAVSSPPTGSLEAMRRDACEIYELRRS